jgi:hypothetical protein
MLELLQCTELLIFVVKQQKQQHDKQQKQQHDKQKLRSVVNELWRRYAYHAGGRVPAGYLRFGPIEIFYVLCDLSVREKDWRGKPGL